MFNKKFILIIALTAVLSAGCSTENAEYGAADGGNGGINMTVFSNGGVQIDHPDEGYVEYIPPKNTSSDSSEDENLLDYDTVMVTKEQLSEIAADTSYADILEKLGKTQAFGQPRHRQYVTDDGRIVQLHFENKDELCPYSGAELYERALPLEYNGENPDNMVYGLLAGDGNFFVYYMAYFNEDEEKIEICTAPDGSRRITGEYLMTGDAEIVFEDGSPATADDLKPETALLVDSDYTLQSYPGRAHCTKIVILK
ncbi:MAG: hypothetical protein HDT43_12105 [Ruminococcaceae bacterium]|nr:hypothetical protein [Oscillospiraceae bacterium]